MSGEGRAKRTRRSRAVLPLHSRTRLSNAISCWYCDLKITACNRFLFALGSRHASYLRVWFTIGVGASFMASAVITLILLQQLACTVHLSGGGGRRSCNLPFSWLIGVPSWASGLRLLSVMDVGVMIFSTLVSVFIHELGHAVAATSQGIQIEYLALFLSVIFPGALVAFNEDVLQALPTSTTLRIYCAGVWHNIVSCAVCGLALLSLPAALYPLYIHGERPTVLSVSPTSPLAGYLSPGDIIMSLNDLNIRNPQQWVERMAHLDNRNDSVSSKGYCIPISWMDKGAIPSCRDDLVAFSSISSDGTDGDYCFLPQDVVKLKKCGRGCPTCSCSEDERCLAPVQSPQAIWADVTVSRQCLKLWRNETSTAPKDVDFGSTPCLESFVFVGDVSVAESIELSAYQPRWALGSFSIYIPGFLEKALLSLLRVSASLSLLNCMPVFYLDGESMLEASLGCVTWLDPPGRRRRIFRLVLWVGTCLFAVAIARVFFSIYRGDI